MGNNIKDLGIMFKLINVGDDDDINSLSKMNEEF